MKKLLSIVVYGSALSTNLAYGASCAVSDLRMRWPLQGNDGVDWVINNYVDQDRGAGMRDYRGNIGGAAKTYNNHSGIDIDLPSTREMEEGVYARAVADGVVKKVDTRQFDRNFECRGEWNYITVEHANGFTTTYGHLRMNGHIVREGMRVSQGDALALVGSSGCSSNPHLHLETKDCDGNIVDPFQHNMWMSTPAYDTTFQLMDLIVRKGELRPVEEQVEILMYDPQTFNVSSISAGATLGVGVHLAGGQSGDVLTIQIVRPNGEMILDYQNRFDRTYRHSIWRTSQIIPSSGVMEGTWYVNVFLNDAMVRTYPFTVIANDDAVLQGMDPRTYQHNFRALKNDGYHPVVVDGSGSAGYTNKISAVYRRGQGTYIAAHNQDSVQFQQTIDRARGMGLQMLMLDTYPGPGIMVHSGVFGPSTGSDWQTYQGYTREEHQREFDIRTARGYHPTHISVVKLNGREYYSALYTNERVGTIYAMANLTSEQYKAEFRRQYHAGRGLISVDVYDDGSGMPKFSAIWTEQAHSGVWVAEHDLTEEQYSNYNEARAREGYHATHITSYLKNNQRYYAGIWRQ